MTKVAISAVFLAVIAAGELWPMPASGQATAFASIAVVPQDTAKFLSYCRTEKEICTNAVTDVMNETQIEMLYGKYGCLYPRPEGDTREARHLVRVAHTQEILRWLESKGASAPATTKEAVKQATAALWPSECQKNAAVLHSK